MKKYFVLTAGILTQIVLGSIYSWSEIAANMASQWNLVSWQTQLIYGMSIAVFSFGTIVTGPMVRKHGPRKMTILSAATFALAFGCAWLSKGHFAVLFPAIGIGVGVAMALGYVVPLSTATLWFPDKKGTVTGLAVMGFGGGAIITSRVIRHLSNQGWEISRVLLLIGLVGGAVLAFSAIFQSLPEAVQSSGKDHVKSMPSVRAAMRKKIFWGLCATMFLSTIGGLIVIGSVVSIANEWSLQSVALLAVSIIALGNALGRLLWGKLLDVLGHRAIPISLILMTLGFALILFAGQNQILFLAGILLSGLQFGASLVIFAAFTEELFGQGAISKIYPLIFAAYGIAALVGPTIGGVIFDLGGSFRPVIIMSLFFPLAALALSLLMKNFKPAVHAQEQTRDRRVS